MKDDRWLLEWSQKHNSFQVKKAEAVIERNLNSLLNDTSTDYITVCIGTQSECKDRAARFKLYLMQRANQRYGR